MDASITEPGGYLQWDETDADATEIVSTHVPASAPNFRTFQDMLGSYHQTQSAYRMSQQHDQTNIFRWVANLPTTFESHGLQNVIVYRCREHLWQRKMWSEMCCVLAEEYVAGLRAREGFVVGGDERGLLASRMGEEVKRGGGWSSVLQVVVGRKGM